MATIAELNSTPGELNLNHAELIPNLNFFAYTELWPLPDCALCIVSLNKQMNLDFCHLLANFGLNRGLRVPGFYLILTKNGWTLNFLHPLFLSQTLHLSLSLYRKK